MNTSVTAKLVSTFFAHVMLDEAHMGHCVAMGTQAQIGQAIRRLRQQGESRAIVIRDANKRIVGHAELA